MKFLIICFFVLFVSQTVSSQPNERPSFVKGIYGNPGALLTKGHSFQSLGVNAIFVRSISLTQDLYQTARKNVVRVFVEFPLLNGKYYLEKNPEAWPINEIGEKSPPADWFMGICPTDPGFRQYRLDELQTLMQEYEIDGLWLDYVHWHAQFETPDPILPETCFCDRCISTFEYQMKLKVPEGDIPLRAAWILGESDSLWRIWRSKILTGWVKEMKTALVAKRPNALLGIFYCSWFPSDFNEALYRNLGLNVYELAGIADVLSPMLFHRMMDRPTAWVHEYVAWLDELTSPYESKKPAIWPIVQAHNKPGVVTAQEFYDVMKNGSHTPAGGIMMFSEQSLLENPEKLNVVKEFYGRH